MRSCVARRKDLMRILKKSDFDIVILCFVIWVGVDSVWA